MFALKTAALINISNPERLLLLLYETMNWMQFSKWSGKLIRENEDAKYVPHKNLWQPMTITSG